jgi:uncharacterized membrane protein YphA (DoxX/SURF4 family)
MPAADTTELFEDLPDRDRGQAGGGLGSALLLLLRVALGGIFLFAAWMKLQSSDAVAAFGRAIQSFDLGVPLHLAKLSSYLVPWAEVVTGVALIFGLWTRAAAMLLLSCMIVFTAAIAIVLSRGKTVECGCFGDFNWPCGAIVTQCHLYRNAGLCAVILLLVIFGSGRFGLDALWSGRARRA